MWSRDRNFDDISGRWYQRNHFMPLLKSEQLNKETNESKKTRGAKIRFFLRTRRTTKA